VNEDAAEVAAEVTATLDESVGLLVTLDALMLEEILEAVGTPKVADAAEEQPGGEREVIEVSSGADTAAGRPEAGPEANPW
jgi:hypothetical protein